MADPPVPLELVEDIIDALEQSITQRVPAALFRNELVVAALATGDHDARVGALVYEAAHRLDQLELSRGRPLVDEALALRKERQIESVFIDWAVVFFAATLADQERRVSDSLHFAAESVSLAWSHGLGAQWAKAVSDQINMLRRAGEYEALLREVHKLVGAPLGSLEYNMVLVIVGDLFQWSGHISNALNCFERVTRGSVKGFELNLANIYLSCGEPRRAIEHLDAFAAGIDPSDSTRIDWYTRAACCRAEALLALGDHEGAVALAMNVRDRIAGTESAAVNLGVNVAVARILHAVGNAEGALSILDELDRLPVTRTMSESSALLRVRADACAVTERWEQAHESRAAQLRARRASQLTTLQQSELRRTLVGHGYGTFKSDPIEVLLRRLDETLVERSCLTTLVAKDLRGPLAAIGLAVELLSESRDSDLRGLLRAATSSLELEIEALTDVDRLESNAQTGNVTQVELGEIVRRSLARVDELLREAQLVVDQPEPIAVVADDHLVLQALTYMLRDVTYHMPSRSTVRIDVRRTGAWANIRVTTNEASVAVGEPSFSSASFSSSVRDRFVLHRLVDAIQGDVVDASPSDAARDVWLRVPVDVTDLIAERQSS